MAPSLFDLHPEPIHLPKHSFQSKDSNFLVIQSENSTKNSPFCSYLHSGMVEWASLPQDILAIIAEHLDCFEDFFTFFLVCKSWQSVLVLFGKSNRTLPPRCPWVMLTDIAETNFPKVTADMDNLIMLVEEVQKNEQIEGMNKRPFFSFSTSETYEFELPEATRKKCYGVGNGWLMTVDFDLQMNLLHPFSRQQVGLPPFLSFTDQYEYDEEMKPQEVVSYFVTKAIMSSNPYNSSNEDCIILAIYGQFGYLAFARPGDKVWTDIYPRIKCCRDVVYYNGKFYALGLGGVVVVCDIHNVKKPTATPIACIPERLRNSQSTYLVESSGSLLVVGRFRKGPSWPDFDKFVDDTEDDVGHIEDDLEDDVGHIEDDDEQRLHYTVSFSIFKLEECHGERSSSDSYPYRLVPVKNLGDKSLFLGYNASVSLPCSNNVKANHIYFCEDDPIPYGMQPYGGGFDTGIYDVESGSITKHYASEFTSHLTPPMWYI